MKGLLFKVDSLINFANETSMPNEIVQINESEYNAIQRQIVAVI